MVSRIKHYKLRVLLNSNPLIQTAFKKAQNKLQAKTGLCQNAQYLHSTIIYQSS